MKTVPDGNIPSPRENLAVVSAGHPLAADIAWDVLERGGNMVDAGVAAVLALTVLHSEQVQLGGILPILVRPSGSENVMAVEGVGRWPRATDRDVFQREHRGRMPRGILRTVTPALPDACLSALEAFGTMPFADLAKPAQKLAAEGFAAHDDLVSATVTFERHYRANPENAAIWLPHDRPVLPGEVFRQPKLAKTFRRFIDAGLEGGDEAVRQLFYKGELAAEMIAHIAAEGGLLSADDLAEYRSPIKPATSGQVFGAVVHTCGPWSQGPCLTQILQIAEALGVSGEPTAEWWHLMLEAMKLGFSDRDRYYGDPDFVDVPMDRLLSAPHSQTLAASVTPIAPMPMHMEISGEASLDTSVVVVADRKGGVFVATPSDMSHDAPAVPGLGFVMSTRGGQSQVSPEHPASLEPGKRPRASASPFIVTTDDGRLIAGGGPGADLAIQSGAAVLTQHLSGGLDLAEAIAAPRVFTLEPPGSSAPHLTFPGKVRVEPDVPDAILDGLVARGHHAMRDQTSNAVTPSICAIELNPKDGTAKGFGDHRRLSGQRCGALG